MDKNSGKTSLTGLSEELRLFVAARDWEQFHSPKNLASAVSVEAAELLELFMWLTPEQSVNPSEELRGKIEDELGDVLICLLNLSRNLNIDLLEAGRQKLEKTKAKYPVDKSKGLAKKYNEL